MGKEGAGVKEVEFLDVIVIVIVSLCEEAWVRLNCEKYGFL
jgi:hypothetical protein